MTDGHAFYLGIFIALFVLLMIFGVYIQSVFGAQGADRLPTPPDFQYYYKTIGVKINEIKPEVCFFEPEDDYVNKRFWKENWFGIGTDALNEWKYNLQQETGVIEGWTWDYKIFLLQDHVGKSTKDLAFRECNIFVVYEKLSETGVIGQAASHYENSFHGYTFITVWTQTTTGGSTTIYLGESFNESKVIKNPGEVVDISKDNIGKILQHEFGHALGLEHQYRTLNGVASNSIMVENLDITKENLNRFVTDNDIQAVILMYGEDGFGGWNNPIREKYIIIP
jgi:hypothetical protein